MKRARSEFSYLEFLAAHHKPLLARILWYTDRATVAAFKASGLFVGVIAEFRLLERLDFDANRYDGLDCSLPNVIAVATCNWTVAVSDDKIVWYQKDDPKTEKMIQNDYSVVSCAIGETLTVMITKESKVLAADHGANVLQILGIMLGNRRVRNACCGYRHFVILTTCGEAWAFGLNSTGQVGVANITKLQVPVPTQMAIDNHVVAVACGANHTLLLTRDGHVFACGQNYTYQLGMGTTNQYNIPTRVTLLHELVTSIGAGIGHSVFVGVSGKVYSCGFAKIGCTGHGNPTTDCVKIPTHISFDDMVIKVVCGLATTVLITASRAAYYCGAVNWPGFGFFDCQAFVPTRVPAKYPVVDAVCGNTRLILKYAPAGVDTGFPAL